MNMLATIIPKSDQTNADDLIGGKTMTIKITKVDIRMDEQPVAVHFEGDAGKPYKPGKSMRRVLVNAWGPDANVYAGRSLTLYRDDAVKFGGMDVGGIRISHMSHIDRPLTMALTTTKAQRKPFTVKPLAQEAPPPPPPPTPRASVADWIATKLPLLLVACQDIPAVAAVQAGKVYQAAQAKASDAEREAMAAQVKAALERIEADPFDASPPIENDPALATQTPTDEDDGWPGPRTTDQAAK